MNDIMPFLKDFAFEFAGKAIIVMLIVVICGLLILNITKRIKR